jgi:hypothetical protein
MTSSDRPFRTRVTIGGVPVELRMDSWLSVDTIRRMGFGHVIAARRHTMIVERGVSFVTFDEEGRALTASYIAGIFAPEPRFIVDRRAMVE